MLIYFFFWKAEGRTELRCNPGFKLFLARQSGCLAKPRGWRLNVVGRLPFCNYIEAAFEEQPPAIAAAHLAA